MGGSDVKVRYARLPNYVSLVAMSFFVDMTIETTEVTAIAMYSRISTNVTNSYQSGYFLILKCK